MYGYNFFYKTFVSPCIIVRCSHIGLNMSLLLLNFLNSTEKINIVKILISLQVTLLQ